MSKNKLYHLRVIDDDTDETETSSTSFEYDSDLDHQEQEANEKLVKTTQLLASTPRLAGRQVSFSTVEIRKYPLTMGDNPSCNYGPPTTLQWNYIKRDLHSLDDYEKMLRPQSSEKKKVRAFSHHQRKLILINEGFTKKERKSLQGYVRKSKNQRMRSRIISDIQLKCGMI
mmetsp:Transcript_7033/g.15238  ORF Transcript_7033/g.15238 Transcript_7033/m.15238 type:complete len:171 (-) Transcript_7033:577-1089(-)